MFLSVFVLQLARHNHKQTVAVARPSPEGALFYFPCLVSMRVRRCLGQCERKPFGGEAVEL